MAEIYACDACGSEQPDLINPTVDTNGKRWCAFCYGATGGYSLMFGYNSAPDANEIRRLVFQVANIQTRILLEAIRAAPSGAETKGQP
jgi:hypothetical protein